MPITVRIIDLRELRRFVTKEDMAKAGQYALRLQRERIAKGIGQRGRRMKRYSREYREERAEKGLPTDRRTLRLSGRMLDSRKVVAANEKSARIGFQNAPRYAYVQQARTPFVKATKDERDLIRKYLVARIKRRTKQNLQRARASKR